MVVQDILSNVYPIDAPERSEILDPKYDIDH